MKAYPLELHHLRFLEVSVKARKPARSKEWPKPFDFDGVSFIQNITVTPIKHKDAPPHSFSLRFRNSLNNDHGKVAPYDVTLDVVGIFSVHPAFNGSPDDLVLFSGCGVLWSAMRDMLWSITSRSGNGELLLPTATFLDIKETAVKKEGTAVQDRPKKTTRGMKRGAKGKGSRKTTVV